MNCSFKYYLVVIFICFSTLSIASGLGADDPSSFEKGIRPAAKRARVEKSSEREVAGESAPIAAASHTSAIGTTESVAASSIIGSSLTAVEPHPIYADPKFDTSFKHMFSEDETPSISPTQKYDVLSAFISTFLGKTVTIVKSVTSFIPPLREGSESQRAMDIACEDDKGIKYNIEMQQAKQSYWDKRAIYYLSSLYEQQINSAAYEALQPVVGISILGYDRTDFEDYKRHYKFIDTASTSSASAGAGSSSARTSGHELDLMQLILISLPRAERYQEALNSVEQQWVYLLNHASNEKKIPEFITDPMVVKAFKRLEYATWGDTVKADYNAEVARHRDEERRIDEAEIRAEARGEAKGRTQALLEVVNYLKEKGASPEVAAATSHLPLEQIKEIYAKKY